ncbi:MAG TPA: glycosyltransferase family 4 protein [Planctomycetota bacterium]|nr:glycosyltransferase family 4 protein [Planctomycetota bacterium]
MRILLVSHNYLPGHTAGTEVYTAQLAKKLAARGHEVSVFTTEKEISAEHFSVRERVHDGIRVHELVNNLHYEAFRATWDEPRIDARFAGVLEALQPDVVHVQHLLYLSVGCVEAAQRRGIPVVFTLHDYWLQCARFGQRVHADTSICHAIDFQRCGECLASFKYRQSPLERRAGNALASLRSATGVDLGKAAVRVSRMLPSRADAAAASEVHDDVAVELARDVALRDRDFRERLVPAVERFLSPSHFLRERFVEWGLPADKIIFLRTGIDVEHFHPRPRTRSSHLRVAFIGTLAPHKGPHVLLRAWSRIDPALRARGRLKLLGPALHNPEYVRELEQRAAALDVELRGALPREAIAAELAATDVLVVPSIWYENSPLVILEAIAARTPLCVSDIGGMAELVEEGVSGFRFQVGDAGDLAARLSSFLRDPALLDGLYRTPEPIKRVDDDAAQLEEVYFEALESVRVKLARGREQA